MKKLITIALVLILVVGAVSVIQFKNSKDNQEADTGELIVTACIVVGEMSVATQYICGHNGEPCTAAKVSCGDVVDGVVVE